MADRTPLTEIRCEASQYCVAQCDFVRFAVSRAVQWALPCPTGDLGTLSTLRNVPSVTSHVPPWLTTYDDQRRPSQAARAIRLYVIGSRCPRAPGTSLSQSGRARNSRVLGFFRYTVPEQLGADGDRRG